jgi:beta-mannosidase
VTSYRSLHEGWTLTGADVVDLPAAVPGCVHTDLLTAGLIEDPYLDENETELAWIGRTEWTYSTFFLSDLSSPRVDLVCAGLDTVTSVFLNGEHIGQTANMHRGYRFDIRDLLRDGTNTLKIKFNSAYAYAEEQRNRLGDRPNAYPEPFNFIRKQACNFGWDWGPTLVTAGIWQPIGLESWSVARLGSVRPQVTVNPDGTGRVELRVRLDRASPAPVTITATVAGHSARATVDGEEALLILTVDEPDLWWPRGHGDQPLYDLAVFLQDASGNRLDDWSRRIGFRSARIDTTGDGFTVLVNEVPVFVRGVNWIPDDVFATRVTRSRLAARFRQAADANVNYLRVWGGGRYESDDFYDLADEMGFLVGQDFLFACAAYPEEEPFRTEVEAEARENVVRLAAHPSLVLWTGNNENLWGHQDWDWKPALGGRTWGAGFYFDLLPRVVAELDPSRAYWPGSPYSGTQDRHPNDPAFGTTHIWDVWNTDDYTKYGAYRPRFVAEFGFQAPPTYATLRRSIADEPLAPDSPGMAHHQKAAGGLRRLALSDPAQPGAGARLRYRALPLAAPALHGHHHVAAQRLLAGHVLVGRRRRRSQETPLVRAARRLRRPAAHPATPHRRPAHRGRPPHRPCFRRGGRPRRRTHPDRGQRRRHPVADHRHRHPPQPGRRNPGLGVTDRNRRTRRHGHAGPTVRSGHPGRPGHRADPRGGRRSPSLVVLHLGQGHPVAGRVVRRRGHLRGRVHTGHGHGGDHPAGADHLPGPRASLRESRHRHPAPG